MPLFIITGCDEEVTPIKNLNQMRDTIPPVIVLNGSKVDTAYLYAPYNDLGARVYDDLDGVADCNDFSPVLNITGSVNTRLPGKYFIHYNATDANGKALATITRTVYVIANAAGFLNGNYNVACTCTAITRGLPQPDVSNTTYTATVASGSANRYFTLTALKIGPEFVVPNTILQGQNIDVGYFSPDYHISSSGTGTISAAKNSFTINTLFYQYAPMVTHQCSNIYTKQLVIR